MSKLKDKCLEVGGKYYTLVEHLKDGGNGSIWRAEYNSNYYAIKFLNQAGGEKKQRFLEEINFCKESTHENLIKINDYGEYDGKLFYVMPLYKKNLRDIIENETNHLNYFDFILQICEGLKFIHDKGVIHRDIKPENILLEGHNLVLADLGIAHFKESNLTHENDLLANRMYAAPEQKKKGQSKEVKKAADIYALGCITNEIFTKKNPSGTNYIVIADIYPWLGKLDGLIEVCMRQNPMERPSIEEIILEIKLIKSESEDCLKDIKNSLKEYFEFEKIHLTSSTSDKILSRASEDILAAKYIFENLNHEEIKEYNYNYNCDIHYRIDDWLKKYYFDKLLYNKCKEKFNYESNAYKNGSKYKPLDLDSDDDRKIFEEFKVQIKKYGYNNGRTLILFSSCCDYHCKELIKNIEDINKQVEDLNDAPILYIVMKLRDLLGNNLIEIKEINIEHHILISCKLTVDDFDKSGENVNASLKQNRVNQEETEILNEFREKWNIVFSKNNKGYIIRFQDENSYNEFKKYSLKLSKPYYIFEGDVLDLIKIQRSYDGIVELKPLDSFEVNNVLAKILGLRKDY